FTEMPTQNFVESSFWNFDALFQPQQHPARDQHDTFFLQDPAEAPAPPPAYAAKVKKVHSQGGYGSQGYKSEWRMEEARRNLLRTHTTAASARALYRLGALGRFVGALVGFGGTPRVWRSLVGLGGSHGFGGALVGLGETPGAWGPLSGISRLRFKPAYNPYTEPSVEIFSYHQGLGRWVELGNSGVFRP
ncbi:SYFA ligase, partial [Caloenas nicobarica]|nr:SYFA ligase [Caloenas nicobarica]